MKIIKIIVVNILLLFIFVNYSYSVNYSKFYTKDKNFNSRKMMTKKIIKADDIESIISSAKQILEEDFGYKEFSVDKDYGFIIGITNKKSSSVKKIGNAVGSVALRMLSGNSFADINSLLLTQYVANIKVRDCGKNKYEIRILFEEIKTYERKMKIKLITKEKIYASFFDKLCSNLVTL